MTRGGIKRFRIDERQGSAWYPVSVAYGKTKTEALRNVRGAKGVLRGAKLRAVRETLNPTRRRAAKRKNAAPKSRSLSLRNFTGKVRLNPDKTVSVLGVGKRKKKTTTKRRRR